jgi:PKD repeat protein
MNLNNHTKIIKQKRHRPWLCSLLAFILLSVLSSTEAKASCTARFTYSVSANAVTFYDSSTFSSTGKHTYTWIWGDGTANGSGTNPTHKYAHYDTTYHVCLAIYDSATGCRDTICKYVKTNGICSASFTYSVSGKTVSVKSTSTSSSGNIKLHWLFKRSGGTTIDQAHNVTSYSYTLPYYDSSYYVCLAMYDTVSNCSDTKCTSIKAGPNPASKACNAQFVYTVSGDTVTFVDSSTFKYTGTHIRYWTFGDGTTGYGTSIKHIYSYYDSTFHVCLILRDSSGSCSDTICKYIKTGKGTCRAYFTDSIAGKTIYFKSYSSTTSGKYKLSWSFGDGTVAHNVTSISHTYASFATSYGVCLTVTDSISKCSSSYCLKLTTGSASGGCRAGFTSFWYLGTAYFYDSSSFASSGKHSYTWLFGDGTSATGSRSAHTYKLYGTTYHACLAIYDSSTGCRDTFCTNIKTPGGSCHASFTDSISGKTVYFKNTSTSTSGTYRLKWIFGDGTVAHNIITFSHTFPNYDSTYQVCLILTDSISNCSDTFCTYLKTGPNGCSAKFSWSDLGGGQIQFKDLSTSSSGKHSVSWNFGDKGTSTSANPSHTYGANGFYYVCLTIKDSVAGCTNTYCDSLKVKACYANFGYEAKPGSLNYSFIDLSSTKYPHSTTWSFGDGTSSTGINPTHTYTKYNQYVTVCLTVKDSVTGCTAQYCRSFYTNCPLQYFTYTVNKRIVTFTNASKSPLHVYWSFGDGTYDTTHLHTVSHRYPASDSLYTVCMYATDSNYCNGDSCIRLNLHSELCTAMFSYSISGKTVSFKAFDSTHDASNYSWSMGDGTTKTGKSLSYTYSKYDSFYVCLSINDSAANCSSKYCTYFKLKQPTYCISGDVYANKNSAGSGIAYLITYNSSDSTVAAIDSEQLTVDTAGTHYKFCGLKPGTYYVKVALDTNSINYSDYVPTYYEKHEKWKQADSIAISSSDQTGKDINMKKGHNKGGNGFIAGKVSKGAGKTGDPVPGLEILLYDKDGNIVDYTYSDASGQYQFQYLPFGEYQVWPEVIGLTTFPGYRYLNDSTPEQIANIEVTPTEAIVMTPTGIKQLLNGDDNASIYPNPVYNNMYVKLHSGVMQQARILVYDMTGKVAYNQTEMLQAGDQTISIDTRTLPSGLYMMQVQMGHDSQVLQTKFIKAQ